MFSRISIRRRRTGQSSIAVVLGAFLLYVISYGPVLAYCIHTQQPGSFKAINAVIETMDPQTAYAFSSLVNAGKVIEGERRELRGAEFRGSGDTIPNQTAGSGYVPAIKTPEDAAKALQTAIEGKLNCMLTQPGGVSLAGIKEMRDALAMVAHRESGLRPDRDHLQVNASRATMDQRILEERDASALSTLIRGVGFFSRLEGEDPDVTAARVLEHRGIQRRAAASDRGPFPARNWMTPEVNRLELRHAERAFLRVTVRVPQDASAGDHHADLTGVWDWHPAAAGGSLGASRSGGCAIDEPARDCFCAQDPVV